MAFLDNSGDIILDAVLTDTGRFRMARGDFRIVKFALGDDEIDYSLYNKNHPSGSSFYDLEVLRTPILEAFTNNTSLMKSRLLSISRTNILHMPVLKLHNGGFSTDGNGAGESQGTKLSSDLSAYLITVDENTETAPTSLKGENVLGLGIIRGSTPTNLARADSATIAVELGLDTTQLAPTLAYPSDLIETQFIVELDSRLGSLVTPAGEALPVSFVDDDGIASYFIGAGTGIVSDPFDTLTEDNNNNQGVTRHRVRGPRDKVIQFKVLPNTQLANSNFLFDRLGSTLTTSATLLGVGTGDGSFASAISLRFIDSFVRVTAATVGVSVDVPVRFLKKV